MSKAISKKDVREFVEKKVDGIRVEVQKDINDLLAELDPVIGALTNVMSVEATARKAGNDVKEVLEGYKDMSTYYTLISKANDAINRLGHFGKEIRSHVRAKAEKFVEYPNSGVLVVEFKGEALIKKIEELQVKTKPLYKKLSDLITLKSELVTVVNNASSGNKAYKDVVALGVDMTGFEKAPARLPAVIKLSVDPCMINGNCK